MTTRQKPAWLILIKNIWNWNKLFFNSQSVQMHTPIVQWNRQRCPLWSSGFEFRADNLCAVFLFFFKYGPISASFSFIFILFTSQINYKLKKRRWSAWDSNPGPQDGRCRRNHGAMAATHLCAVLLFVIVVKKVNSKINKTVDACVGNFFETSVLIWFKICLCWRVHYTYRYVICVQWINLWSLYDRKLQVSSCTLGNFLASTSLDS